MNSDPDPEEIEDVNVNVNVNVNEYGLSHTHHSISPAFQFPHPSVPPARIVFAFFALFCGE